MQARALKRLLSLPPAKRLDVIAEGLHLIAEHVETLRADLEVLGDARRSRGFSILSTQAEEEAAKFLILLDLVRHGWKDQQGVKRQIGYFYDHLARSIYAEVFDMRPADLKEVRVYVDNLRESHYLDGPTDVDWIFRNQLISRREDTLYVDYVHDDDGDRWSTPARFDETVFGFTSPLLELIGALRRMGCASRAGLDVVADAWRGVELDDDTRWQSVRTLNDRIVETLVREGLNEVDATDEDASRVVDRWSFPLSSLDLSELSVSLDRLRDIQRGAGSP